jgi:hypothetical protein
MTTPYIRAMRTVVCPYCQRVRSTDNLHQTKPRIKCKPCFESRGKPGFDAGRSTLLEERAELDRQARAAAADERRAKRRMP